MFPSVRWLVSFAAVAACLVACSSSGSSSPTIESTCPSFASALCGTTNQCNAAAMAVGFGSVDACTTRATALCKAAAGAPSTGITPDKIQSCADGEKKLACGEYYKTGISTACPAIAGSLANGAPCVDDAQCSSSFCAKTANTLCGSCAAAPAAGSTCVNGKCASGLVCNGSNTCATAGSSGQKCTSNADCEGDLSCNSGSCSAGAKLGEACDLKGASAPQCDRVTVLWCNPIAKKCENVKSAAAGATCGVDTTAGGLTICDPTSYCKTVDAKTFKGTCTARPADGSACSTDELFGNTPCQTFSVCDSGVCRFPDPTACNK